jgi:hypothetical protein
MGRIISLEDNLNVVYTESAKKILPFTIALYIPAPEKKSIEHLGSGVLLRRNNDYFLVTAGHCMKQDNKIIYSGILDGRDFVKLQGAAMVEQGFEKKFDIGILRLDEQSKNACLRNNQFVNDWDLMNNSNIPYKTEYLVGGYPNSKVSVDHKAKVVKKEFMPYLCQSSEEKLYRKLSFQQSQNLLLQYDRRRSTLLGSGQMSISSYPKGLSGCGVWYIPDYFVQDLQNISPYLSGIIIEYHQNYRTLVATKIEPIDILLKGMST